MFDLLSRLRPDESRCRCEPSFESDRLVVSAADCPGDGDLAAAPDCLETIVSALAERDADVVVTRSAGVERRYEGRSAALLLATGRFVERVARRDEALAARAARDPLAAAAEAAGRAGPVADVAAGTGFAELAARAADRRDALRAATGPTVAHSRVRPAPPAGSRLLAVRDLPTGATVRRYERPDDPLPHYHLEPVEATLSDGALATLAAAHELLATGGVLGGERAAGRAVRRVAGEDDPVETLTAVLRKHTREFGVLSDLFADGSVSDVFAAAPASERPLRVVAGGETMRTNVRLTPEGAAALASRLRRASGRSLSRATPTLDAVLSLGGTADGEAGLPRRVRAAAVAAPATEGTGFAFRAHDREPWTLPALVDAGTLPVEVAALLSLSVERAAAGLVAGTRGAGKTSLLSALLWEIPGRDRVVVVEDTPELPVAAYKAHGRDVQPLRTTLGSGERGLSPSAALRTALRLGEGALVVGEVRGEEARVLYEAMRVGASGSAVLGTVHGDGGAAVRERMVSDLGVPASSFRATDLVVTLVRRETPDGVDRRVRLVEEVVGDGFDPLYETGDDGLEATGRIDRGNSRLVAGLARPGERYADVRAALGGRERFLGELVEDGLTRPADVVAAHGRRRAEA